MKFQDIIEDPLNATRIYLKCNKYGDEIRNYDLSLIEL